MDTGATKQIIETSSGYFPFFLTLFLAGLVSLVALAFAVFIGPKRPSKEKRREYECGIRPDEPVHQRLDVQYYRLGILFLVFGVEVIFFFPWALALSNGANLGQRLWALGDMIVFVVILIAGFVFAWAKGGLRWSKVHGETDREN